MTVCPKCKFDNKAGGLECPQCGIIYDKYKPPASATPVADPSIKSRQDAIKKNEKTPAQPETPQLIPCPVCSHMISTGAKSCPQCGHPLDHVTEPEKIKKENEKPGCGLLAVCFFLIMFFIFWIGSFFKTDKDWRENDNSSMAYVMMQNFVTKRLKSPGTAKFQFLDSENIENLGNQTYRISSYVDSQNSFGAVIRTNFIGLIKQTSHEDWQLLSLNFQQQ